MVPPDARQLHPLTPVALALPLVPALLLIFFLVNGGALWQAGVKGVPVPLILTATISAVYFAYRYWWWQRFWYWYDDSGDIRIQSGIFFRNERKVALSRLQAVDVEQPLVARLIGLAEVRIEVAGAGDSKVKLAYLSVSDAHALRTEILNRAREDGAEASPTIAPPEDVILTVNSGQLVTSLLLRSTTVWLLALTVFLVFVTVYTQGPSGLGLLVVTGGIPLLMVVSEFLTFYGFTVAKAPDGVRIRHGLLKTQSQTVPHGRVAAVELVEPLLWRWQGWIRLRLTIAGVDGGDGNNQSALSRTVLLPVGSREQVMEVLGHVMAGLELDEIELHPAPKQARLRAPIQHSKLAFGFDRSVFVTRRGLVTRHLAVVPHARNQSVSLVQGPFQRALGLSTLRVDIAPGPVNVSALYFSQEVLRDVAVEQAQRARTARVDDWASGPHTDRISDE